MFDLDIGNGGGFFTGTESVLTVALDFKAGDTGRLEAMNQRGQRTVTLTGKLDRLPIAQ
jgi:hypothetical protein